MISTVVLLNKFMSRFGSYQMMTSCSRKSAAFYPLCSLFSHKLKLRKLLTGRESPCTYSKCAHFYSTRQHSLSDLTHGINTEALKEKCRRHLLMTGNEIQPEDLVKEELKMRFNQAVENLTEQQKRILKIIQLEHSFLFSEGYAIPPPEEMTNENWLQAMTLGTLEERFDYYVGIEDWKNQQVSSVGSRKKEAVSGERVYDNPNSIFYDCENPELEVRWGNYRLASAMQFGIPFVIDMDFVDMNSATELIPLTQQLWDMYCVNRTHPEPFHLIFTNCSESNPIYRHLVLHHMVKTPFVLASFTEKSHIDLFPRQDMVYLSAQSTQCLGDFNPNAVYIAGAYFDPLVRKKGSFARARQHKIKCFRFPITECVRWRHQASKDLDMNHVVAILLSVKAKVPWKNALISHVPMLINQNS